MVEALRSMALTSLSTALPPATIDTAPPKSLAPSRITSAALTKASRKPSRLSSADAAPVDQLEDDNKVPSSAQSPPRQPGVTASSHSPTFPLMSNAPYALALPLVPTVVTLPSWPFQSAATSKFAKLPVLPAVPTPLEPAVTAVGSVSLCVA